MSPRFAVFLVAVIGLAAPAAAQTTPAPGCPTQAAVLNLPANGATNVASPVKFDWSDVAGATAYHLWASFNGGAANIIAITKDSEYTTSLPAGSVEWWVDALSGSCTPVTSAHFRLTVSGGTATCPANLTSPTLTSPVSGAANLSSPVNLVWSAVQGASGYNVFAQVNGAAAAIIGTTTSTQLSAPFPQGSVAWFVQATFPGCPATFSRISTFTVASGTACSNAAATLLAPANGASNVTSPVTFQWSAVPGAVAYTLYIGSSSTSADAAGTTTDTSLTPLLAPGTFTWWVVTSFAGCPNVTSSQFTFTIPAPNACSGSISLLTPAENASVTSPASLSWTAVPNTTAYRIWVSIDGSAPVILARTSATSQSLFTPSGNVAWFVEALLPQCPSILSPEGHFAVAPGTACGANKPPTLVSPLNGAQVQSPVDFNWSNANGAMLYRVWVAVNGGPFEDVGITKNSQLTTDVPAGNIQWYVETFFNGCQSVNTATAAFTIPGTPGCSNDTPLLISPADGASSVTAPVTLVWSAAAGATEYRVFSRFNGGAPLLVDRTAGTASTKTLVPGTVEWWVAANFDGCPDTKSIHSHFTIPRAASCGTDVPQLVAPASGATNVASPVLLDWNPVSDAVGYAVYARFNGGTVTRLGTTTSDTDLMRRLPEGSFEWWVTAFFAACPPLESQHATFATASSNCANRPPLLMTPADGAAALTSPVHLSWSPVPNATSYKVWTATDGNDASVLATTTDNKLTTSLPAGTINWYVEARFASCPATTSATSSFSVLKSAPPCNTPGQPVARVAGQVASGTPFTIHWTPVANAANYTLLEATKANFNGATSQVVSDVSITLTRTTGAQPTRYYYRVRAVSNCSDDHGPYSKVISVVVLPLAANAEKQTSIDVGSTNGAAQQIVLPGQTPPVTFSAHGDKPWITVSPSAGTLGPQGVTLTVNFDPAALKLGTNTGTVIVSFGGGSGKIATNGVQPVVPVSISLVTPVAPVGKNTPPPDSLIIPAVGHAPGANNSQFESDVRVANTTAQTMSYQLNFTLSGTDGTQSGQSTTIQIDPGATMSLDDILSNFFGIGADGGSATGVLEIRPLTSSTTSGAMTVPSVQTVAASRTFNSTPNGTYGQFIPAIPFSQFVGQGTRISLQQIAQSTAFRTNLGLVEAAGENATVLVHVFDTNGVQLAQIPESLMPSEHMQLNSFLAANNISLTDGRIEVEVTSPTGKVSAYASVVDNVTNDPLVVFPVTEGTVSSNRYVVPGVADINNSAASWRSDMRLYNSGSSPVTATLSYFPQPGNPGASGSVQKTVQPGAVLPINNALQSLFSLTQDSGGSILVTTPTASGLVVTARTYNQTSNGTYGQFIPAVTPSDAVGAGDRTLQLLQLESSTRFRTNIGLAEVSGSAATAHVSLILPDSKFAISTDIPLGPNQFVQIPLDSFGAGTVYNARVSVSVTGGSGRITAYGSVIDQTTQDPTYVPAQ